MVPQWIVVNMDRILPPTPVLAVYIMSRSYDQLAFKRCDAHLN